MFALIHKLLQVEEQLGIQRGKLEETRSSMQNSKSRGRVNDALMEQVDFDIYLFNPYITC